MERDSDQFVLLFLGIMEFVSFFKIKNKIKIIKNTSKFNLPSHRGSKQLYNETPQ